MSVEDGFIDWPVGVPTHRLEGTFVKQRVVEKPKAPFSVELPGLVVRAGGMFGVSIVPAACVVLEGDAPLDYAVVHAAITDQKALGHELKQLAEAFCTRPPESFSVAVRAEQTSTADVVLAAEANALGGCGCKGRPAAIPARVELILGQGKKRKRSPPIRAAVMPVLSAYPPCGDSKELTEAFYLFDCHSEWQGIPGTGHWTYCRGPCPAGEVCICDNFPKKASVCDGWDFCHCS